MPAEIDAKVTELAKAALAKPDSWVTVIVLALWSWWLSYQLAALTKKLRAQAQEALEKRLAAEEEARRVSVAQLQGFVEVAAAKAEAARKEYVAVDASITDTLVAADVVKSRISKLKNWKDLDALAQGN